MVSIANSNSSFLSNDEAQLQQTWHSGNGIKFDERTKTKNKWWCWLGRCIYIYFVLHNMHQAGVLQHMYQGDFFVARYDVGDVCSVLIKTLTQFFKLETLVNQPWPRPRPPVQIEKIRPPVFLKALLIKADIKMNNDCLIRTRHKQATWVSFGKLKLPF